MTAPLLPEPSPEALAASQRLVARIGAEIDTCGGWIGFDRFMSLALYEPQLGYYTGGSRKFGAAGDFVTGPELSPLFGASLAVQIAAWLEDLPLQVLEFGAGTGALAAQVLNELARLGYESVRYQILEVSASLRERQRHTIAMLAPERAAQVEWLDALPERIEGVVLANEVLDAMPVRAFGLHGARLVERGVARDADGFRWADRAADADLVAQLAEVLDQADWPVGELVAGPADARAPEGQADEAYRSELGEQAIAWTRTLMHRISRGAVLLIDYGFPARELYHPQRNAGTLMCHYRHHAHDDPFYLPGLQDITAHVDFTAIALAAQSAGAGWIAYTSQANFLLNCGVLDRLGRIPRDDPAIYGSQAQAVQRLLSEAEMGELFKVLAFGVGCEPALVGFERGDRSHRL